MYLNTSKDQILQTNHRGEFQSLLLLQNTLECKIKFTSMYIKTDINGGECRRKVDVFTHSIPQKEQLIILRMTNGDWSGV